MRDFGNCIQDAGLVDLGYEGIPFTWPWREVKQTLDRIFVNNRWLDLFGENRVIHAIRRCSDHRPLILRSNFIAEATKSSFHFQNMWLHHPDCLKSIATHWNLPALNYGVKKLWEKLKRLKQQLKYWNKPVFGYIFDKVRNQAEAFKAAEAELERNPTKANKTTCLEESSKFQKILDMEESYWQQRAKTIWRIEGAKNTKVFMRW